MMQLKVGTKYYLNKYIVEIVEVSKCKSFSTISYKYITKPNWMDDATYAYPLN